MKTLFTRTLCLSALVAGLQSLDALAGGTVTFGNSSSSLLINSLTGNPVAPADGVKVALYWAPMGSPDFVQISTVVDVGKVLPGVFAGGTCATGPETAGGSVGQFQVRAWSGGYASYEQAVQAMNGLIGQSAVIQVKTGNPVGDPPTPPGSLAAGGLAASSVSPAVVLPVLQIFQTNGINFNASWSTRQTVVVEACTNLVNPVWSPVETNTLTNGSFTFSDPDWLSYPSRFFRLRSQ